MSPEFTVVDRPEDTGGWGDSSSLRLRNPIPNYVVADDRLGFRDAPGGILHFRMLVGEMTAGEAAKMNENINREQRVLERHWRRR